MNHFIYDGVEGDEKIVMTSRKSITHSMLIYRLTKVFGDFIEKNNIKAAIFGDNVDVYFNEVEHYIPDVSIICDPKKIENGKKVLGAPDLIVEVLSKSTMKNDRNKKKDVYEKFGVREYWIVDPLNKSIEVYHLVEGKFILDEVYAITDDDEEEMQTQIKVSIFDDLIVDIHKVFKKWFE